MASLSNMRRELFPQLVSAYEIWAATGDTAELLKASETSTAHWQALALETIDTYNADPAACMQDLVNTIERRPL